jgi:hypothetical protein
VSSDWLGLASRGKCVAVLLRLKSQPWHRGVEEDVDWNRPSTSGERQTRTTESLLTQDRRPTSSSNPRRSATYVLFPCSGGLLLEGLLEGALHGDGGGGGAGGTTQAGLTSRTARMGSVVPCCPGLNTICGQALLGWAHQPPKTGS